MARPPRRPKLNVLATRLTKLEALDAVAKPLGKIVRGRFPPGAFKDALSGVPLGHPLHPVLTDIPIGTWVSATLLDVLGGETGRDAAPTLIGVGVAAAVPTAMSGLNDWADTEVADAEVRRVGAVHAAANVGALALYSASLAARRDGRRGLGVALGLAGLGALAVGGHLGGHLSYDKGVGVDRAAWQQPGRDWVDVLAAGDLPDRGMAHAEVAGVDVLLVRRDADVFALANTCGPRGGSLHEGELVDGCVQCPLHGSRFRLDDGSVERGPCAFPQPVYDVRIEDGRVQVRTPEWAHATLRAP
jgi:nitrite reductase/ring-hydroxylating ferredoxin subunit/uncharacterized membrane protein